MTSNTVITLDLGATKCAAAIVAFHHQTREFVCVKTCSVKLADTVSLADLIEQISGALGMPFHSADAVCIGAAGQYDGSELKHLPGVYPYPMHFAALATAKKWPPYAVIHDYDTVVCATFTSYLRHDDHVIRLNHCEPKLHQRRVALGIGTGLGLKDGVLLRNGDFWLGKNEIGHIGIINPPKTDHARLSLHQEFMRYLYAEQIKSSGQITFENILTGRGLAHLHQF